MSDSPRPKEWTIHGTNALPLTKYRHSVGDAPIHAIEYAIYEAAIKERDEIKKANPDAWNNVWLREKIQITEKERDEARAEFEALDRMCKNELVLNAQPLTAERAKSARLVEALETIKTLNPSLTPEYKLASSALVEYAKDSE